MKTTRPAVLLAAALALAGCGQPPAPTTKDDKGGPGAPPTNVPSAPVAPTDANSVAAEKFTKSLVAGAADPNALSVPFLKAVGLPVLSAEDKAKGYSPAAAQAWLNRVGAGVGALGPLGPLGLPDGHTAANGAVFVSAAGKGRYSLRVVQADGAWKVDWLGVGTAAANDVAKPKTSDEAFQDFAVLGFLDATTSTALPLDDRVPLAAALLSANYRKTQYGPLPGDPEQGFDYNAGKLRGVLDALGTGATAVSRTRTGADTFRAEITKGGAARAFAVKLVRDGAGWVIDEFRPE